MVTKEILPPLRVNRNN